MLHAGSTLSDQLVNPSALYVDSWEINLPVKTVRTTFVAAQRPYVIRLSLMLEFNGMANPIPTATPQANVIHIQV
jgi:hypothetical protein